jgi:hypothetical protein
MKSVTEIRVIFNTVAHLLTFNQKYIYKILSKTVKNV